VSVLEVLAYWSF